MDTVVCKLCRKSYSYKGKPKCDSCAPRSHVHTIEKILSNKIVYLGYFKIKTLKLYFNWVCYESIYVIGFALLYKIHVDKAGKSKYQTETKKMIQPQITAIQSWRTSICWEKKEPGWFYFETYCWKSSSHQYCI